MVVSLVGLGTAVPAHVLPQDRVAVHAAKILGARYAEFDRLSSVFENSGVETRYSVVPFEWFYQSHGWQDRNAAYLEGASDMFVRAAMQALRDAHVGPADVDVVVTVSSTGIATPTLEALSHAELGFREDVMRVPVFGLGCAGGVSGLSVARELCAAQPGRTVLLVAVEACSIAFRDDRLQKADIIASVLFGDGAAAAVMRNAPGSVTLGAGMQHLWPDTRGIMGWDVDEVGFGVVFDRSIPHFVATHFAQTAQRARSRLRLEHIDRFVCHPGGAKVITALEGALELPAGVLDAERDILRRYGNMSAPTALFVLKEVLARRARGQMMLTALGPGFTASFLPLEVA